MAVNLDDLERVIPRPAVPFKPHDDHQRDILNALAGFTLPVPSGYNVLIAVFIRPEKTAGGVILTRKTRDEDEFQGRVGLVLSLGSDAYAGDKFRSFSEEWVKPGDWVIWPLLENAATRFKFNGVVLAVLPDDKMLARIANPMDVY